MLSLPWQYVYKETSVKSKFEKKNETVIYFTNIMQSNNDTFKRSDKKN